MNDASYMNWGEGWRMPTRGELNEFLDLKNYNWKWTTQRGNSGYRVTSNKNGSSFFYNAASYRSEGSLYRAGSFGYYWSRLLIVSYSFYAYSQGLYSSYFDRNF